MTIAQRDKLTFCHLLNKHKITMIALAKESSLPLIVMHALLMGRPVSAEQADKVLTCINRLARTTYALYDVSITLLPVGSILAVQVVAAQCPTQAMRTVNQPTRAVQPKRKSIISSLFGFLLGGGVQWKESY